jgi:tetratricopeptide (TPR) repeat protein
VNAYLTPIGKGAWDPEVEATFGRDDFLRRLYPYLVAALLGMRARPETSVLWRRLARLCEARGEDENARSLLTQALQVNSEDVASLSILARICERQQKLEEAAEWHRRILRVHPGLRVSLLFLAQRHYRLGEYAQAIPYFEQLLSQERGNRLGELYWLLSQLRSRGLSGLEDRISEVMRWQELQAEERPLAQELFVAAGGEHLQQKRFARAEQYFSHAHHLLPSADIARLLAVVEKRRNRALQESQVFSTPEYTRWTLGHDPSTPAPDRGTAQERTPHTTAHGRWGWQRYKGVSLGGILALLLGGGALSIRQLWEGQAAFPVHQDRPPVTVQKQPAAQQEGNSSLRTAEKIDRPVAPVTSPASGKRAGETRGASDAARGRDEESPPLSVLPAGAKDGVARAEPAETRQSVSSSNTPVSGHEARPTHADAAREEEAASGASWGSGHHFVHPVLEYAITPPAGFTLVRMGRRTVWQGPEGTQLLVETTLSPGPSARAGWEQLHAAFIKKYRNRYRSHGITETQLGGRPAAAWEFALTTAAGTTYKRDVAVLDRGVGYGILVSGPAGRFAAWRPRLEAALQSFRLPVKRPDA